MLEADRSAGVDEAIAADAAYWKTINCNQHQQHRQHVQTADIRATTDYNQQMEQPRLFGKFLGFYRFLNFREWGFSVQRGRDTDSKVQEEYSIHYILRHIGFVECQNSKITINK